MCGSGRRGSRLAGHVTSRSVSRVASADEATSSARFTPGQPCGPWLKWLKPQSSAASPSIHSSGAKRSAYVEALAVAVVERVDDQDLRPGRDDGAAPAQLDERLAREQRRRRPQPHRLAEAGAQVVEPGDAACRWRARRRRRRRARASTQRALLGMAADRRERAQRVRGVSVSPSREQPVRGPGRRAVGLASCGRLGERGPRGCPSRPRATCSPSRSMNGS